MKLWVGIAMVILVIIMVQEAEGNRILFLSAMASKSFKVFYDGIVDALADNGHQVTIVSPFKPFRVRDNVREVHIKDMNISRFLPNMFEESEAGAFQRVLSDAPMFCSDTLESKEVQALLKEEFDLAFLNIFLSDCFMALIHILKVPYVHIWEAPLLGPISWSVGNPLFTSFAQSKLFRVHFPYSFAERLLFTLGETFMYTSNTYYFIPQMEAECRRRGLCPEDMPSLNEMRANTSALIINSVRTSEYPPLPLMPNIIYIGGVHCKEPSPLHKDLEEWIAGSGDDGFIFFSLGSIVQSATMPESYRKMLVNVFGSLKQRVLWKWDQDTMEGLPPNVRLEKWLPQQDILGHPRLRLFITHGGGFSTQEARYHGAPVLGLPLFFDQHSNMLETEREGWGLSLEWEKLNARDLKESIHLMMDEKIRAEAKRRSALMRDVPQKPGQVINYWVDYIIRHKGAPHLKSPIISMPWYQVYNVDVWLTVLGVILVVLYIFLKVISALCRCVFSSKSKSKTKKD